ncbi:hypothetical protein GF377_08220, partial [candidate division GN15 bacterium]|nr:hypothetical protein [candidate division GN15 bacterium]
MNKERWLKELQAAMHRGLTVEIDRSKLTDEQLRGFVVSANEKLVVLHVLTEDV